MDLIEPLLVSVLGKVIAWYSRFCKWYVIFPEWKSGMILFQQRHIIAAGLLLSALAWGLDSLIDSAWGDETLLAQLVMPSLHDISHRLVFILFFTLFLVFACRMFRSRDRLLAELKSALTESALVEEALAIKASDLELANRELEAFSYSVSHDLRNPLSVVNAAAQALKEGHSADDELGSYFIEAICDASHQMEDLIDSLLELAQISRSEMEITTVDLSAIADAVCKELRLISSDCPVSCEITPNLVASGDQRMLRVVMENLMGNAWKYSSGTQEPVILFGMQEMASGPAFFIRDNGAGFDQARANELFKPFARLHDPKTFPGTGIGLATVQRIVERHGGKVWAEGGLGEGATFYFTLSPARSIVSSSNPVG